jgi:tRNA threonylcarbamoyladenosine biosynthesis protein TsaE
MNGPVSERGDAEFTIEQRVPTAGAMTGLGGRLARLLAAGDLVVLSGSLGAGKTTLTQGIGAGLNVRGPVTSPTFVIARVHPSLASGPGLVHADAYRLGSRAEVDDLDLDADLATSVTVVEWGEGLVEALAGSYLTIGIEADRGESEADEPRTVRISGWGERWRNKAALARDTLAGEPNPA